jgi:hypothetical protein
LSHCRLQSLVFTSTYARAGTGWYCIRLTHRSGIPLASTVKERSDLIIAYGMVEVAYQINLF